MAQLRTAHVNDGAVLKSTQPVRLDKVFTI